jgi:hypothetical protein
MFEMLKIAYGDKHLSRTSVSEWHNRFKEGQSQYRTTKGKALLELPEQKNG